MLQSEFILYVDLGDHLRYLICFLGIFKNNTTFLIFTNMFRRYIRHRQCDGYESLQ